MSSKILTAAVALCALAGAVQAQSVVTSEEIDAAVKAEATAGTLPAATSTVEKAAEKVVAEKAIVASATTAAVKVESKVEPKKVEAKAVDMKADVKADAKVAEAPAKEALDAVKEAPAAVVSGSIIPTTSPTIDVPAAVSASMPEPTTVSGTVVDSSGAADLGNSGGVTTLDEAFAAISETSAYEAQPETTTMEGNGEKLEDYMKDAARPVDETAGSAAVPMPPDGDDMMGY